MKKIVVITACSMAICVYGWAQSISASKVPAAAKAGFMKMYPHVMHPKWEMEGGNFEGNWKEHGMDHSADFTPSGVFAGSETDIPVSKLPAKVKVYVNQHYHARISEASINRDAQGVLQYEADLKGKSVLFDSNGNFLKEGEGD